MTTSAAAPIRTESGETPMIALRGLTKAFGSKVALRGVNLTVMPGESLVIFGPNGAGKSTLIRILCALSRPTGGVVQIGGLDLPDARRRDSQISGRGIARAAAV